MFIVDHLGAMEPAPSALAWPSTPWSRKWAGQFLWGFKGSVPTSYEELGRVVDGTHEKHRFVIIAGHLLPEDYV